MASASVATINYILSEIVGDAHRLKSERDLPSYEESVVEIGKRLLKTFGKYGDFYVAELLTTDFIDGHPDLQVELCHIRSAIYRFGGTL